MMDSGNQKQHLTPPSPLEPKDSSNKNNNNGTNNKRKRRIRPSYVCIPCRKRKIKCDKQKPCSNCIKSLHTEQCKFENPDMSRVINSPNYEPINPAIPTPISSTHLINSGSATQYPQASLPNSPYQYSTPPMFKRRDILSAHDPLPPLPPIPSTPSQFPTNNEQGIKQDVELLKRQLSNVEKLIQDRQTRQTFGKMAPVNDIINEDNTPGRYLLNRKSTDFKPTCVFFKKSRMLYFGPLAFRTSVTKEPSCKIMFSHFGGLLDTERRAWKQLNSKPKPVITTLLTPDFESSYIEHIEKDICPLYDAMLERLEYFEKNLNYLMFTGFIDMSLVMSYLVTYFKRDSTGKVKFNKPEKCYGYADISLLLGVVAMTDILTELEADKIFKIKFTNEGEIISRSASHALDLSRFQLKQSITGLLALLVCSLNCFTYGASGDGGDGSNTYPKFQMALTMAFQLGLHRKSESIGIVLMKNADTTPFPNSGNRWSKLWNYLKLMDAFYAVYIGTPLMVNDTFCDGIEFSSSDNNGRFDLAFNGMVRCYRDVATTLSSIQPISINEICSLLDRLIQFCSRFEPIESYLYEDPTDPLQRNSSKWVESIETKAWLLLFKMNTLEMILSIQHLLRYSLSNVSLFESVNIDGSRNTLNSKEVEFLHERSKQYGMEALRTAIVIIVTIEKIADQNAIYKNEMRYIMFFKPWLRLCLMKTWATFLSVVLDTTREPDRLGLIEKFYGPCTTPHDAELDSTEKSMVGNIDLNYLDSSIYHKYNGTPLNKLHSFFLRFSNQNQIVKLLVEISEKLNTHPVYSRDYGFFIKFKVMLYFCYYVESVNEFKARAITQDKQVDYLGEESQKSMEEIIKITKEKAAQSSVMGVIDRNLSVFRDEFKLDDVLCSTSTEDQSSIDAMMRSLFDSQSQGSDVFRPDYDAAETLSRVISDAQGGIENGQSKYGSQDNTDYSVGYQLFF